MRSGLPRRRPSSNGSGDRTPQELKNSILQLAIQGKLVEQRPEEGTGEELYREIQREKQALIKAGGIEKIETSTRYHRRDVSL